MEEQRFSEPESHPLLPGWLSMRMMSDCWFFGLMTTNGVVIGISHIKKVWQSADGSVWIDVELLEDDPSNTGVWTPPTTRTTASINTAHIVSAFELMDT